MYYVNVNVNLIKENVIQINGRVTMNNDKCRYESKKHHICEKDYTWNPSTRICKNGKYLASIMDDSVIMCDEIIEETVPTNFNEKKTTYKMQNYYILLALLLITTALLITVKAGVHFRNFSLDRKIFNFVQAHLLRTQ